MRRAPWPADLLLGLALVAIIGLLGPLALFNPWFTSILQVRHDVAGELGTTQAEVQRVTANFLVDLYVDGPFDAALEGDAPFLDAEERAHMSDVAALVRTLAVVLIGAVVLALACGWWLRDEPGRIGRAMVVTSAAVGAVAIVLGFAFAVAFDAAFTAFHNLFFAPGTWQFATGSNLITLFPEPFWFDAALLAGAAILLVAAIVGVAGYLLWRGARTPMEPA